MKIPEPIYFHIWFSPEDSKTKKRQPPIRIDCGAMVGWVPFFLPYIEKKVAALNHGNKTDYYIGDISGNRKETV